MPRTEHRSEEDDHHGPQVRAPPARSCPAASHGRTPAAPRGLPASSPAMSATPGSSSSGASRRSIPLYRLVTFQLERDARNIDGLPQALRTGKVLSAVYRAGDFQKSTGTPEGYGLRLLVEPVMAAQTSAAQNRSKPPRN